MGQKAKRENVRSGYIVLENTRQKLRVDS